MKIVVGVLSRKRMLAVLRIVTSNERGLHLSPKTERSITFAQVRKSATDVFCLSFDDWTSDCGGVCLFDAFVVSVMKN